MIEMRPAPQRREAELERVQDPHVTEPVLTGRMLIGDKGRWRGLRDALVDTRGSGDAVWHACRRSLVEYLNAEERLAAV